MIADNWLASNNVGLISSVIMKMHAFDLQIRKFKYCFHCLAMLLSSFNILFSKSADQKSIMLPCGSFLDKRMPPTPKIDNILIEWWGGGW